VPPRESANPNSNHFPDGTSPYVASAFQVARARYSAKHASWTNLSARLAGRFSLPIAIISLQRLGDLDLLLRCMEDEFQENRTTQAADKLGQDHTFHYQLMLSESWVVSCYEILRAFLQRDDEADLGVNGVSAMVAFRSIFVDLELLRMPLAKYEIAKDRRMKEPLTMCAIPPNDNATDERTYDKNDPTRSHIMPTGMSGRGSMTWLALDHSIPREYWVERQDLADRLLALANEIIPAGILEAQQRAQKGEITT
jgi:hypothetical protein